jgi:hypothetical protein
VIPSQYRDPLPSILNMAEPPAFDDGQRGPAAPTL